MWPPRRTLLRVVRDVEALARVLGQGADVDERAFADVREHVLLERAVRDVVALGRGVLGGLRGRGVRGELAALCDPEVAAAVEEAHVGVAVEREQPGGVRGPPVVLVAVDDERRVGADALRGEESGELGTGDELADLGVVEVGVPVDLHGAGDVARLVEQDVLVRLDDDEVGVVEVLGEPVGGHEALRMRVLVDLRGAGVQCGRHGAHCTTGSGSSTGGRLSK
jgi:hypothetical protein